VDIGIATTRKYQELPDNKGIDAIVVAVPDDWHKHIVVERLPAAAAAHVQR
jgi:predicted dehydrogenase